MGGDAHNKRGVSNTTISYSIIGHLLSFEHKKDIEEGEFELELVKNHNIQTDGYVCDK